MCLCAQWVCVPFLLTNPHSVDISLTAYNQTFQAPWVGTVELDEAGKWFDDFMLLVSGRWLDICFTHTHTHTTQHRSADPVVVS